MEITHADVSCGVRQLFALEGQKTQTVVKETYNRMVFRPLVYSPKHNDWKLVDQGRLEGGSVVFSDIEGPKSKQSPGQRLYAYLKKHPKWGRVHRSPAFRNPNSGNKIRVYTWVLNPEVARNHKLGVR